jgi:hypothetical protein
MAAGLRRVEEGRTGVLKTGPDPLAAGLHSTESGTSSTLIGSSGTSRTLIGSSGKTSSVALLEQEIKSIGNEAYSYAISVSI